MKNPDIKIITRIQYIEEKHLLKNLNVDYVCTESEALKAFVASKRQIFTPAKYF